MTSAKKSPRYIMASSHGDIPKGKIVYLSLHHRPILDSHRMVGLLPCGKGAAYSVPEGLLIDKPYDAFDEE